LLAFWCAVGHDAARSSFCGRSQVLLAPR
jgi:hypothetical protein